MKLVRNTGADRVVDLLRRVHRRREPALVRREPEALRALEAREVAGLAEVEPRGRHGQSVP